MVPMERASVATDGAKWPLEWVPQGIAEQLQTKLHTTKIGQK